MSYCSQALGFGRWLILSVIVSTTNVWSFAGDDLEDKLSPELQRVLDRTSNPVPVIVVLRPVTPLPQTFAVNLTSAQKETLIKQKALQTQQELRGYVNELVSMATVDGEKPLSRYMFFWGVNGFMATATPAVISEIAGHDVVEKVYLDKKIKLLKTVREAAEIEGAEYTYGLEKIGIPSLRQSNPELTGKGVTVGIVDTGIQADHPELVGKTVAFKDFIGNKKEPYDDNGHGTHVAGTIAGSGVGGTHIGIAPDVKLVVAKVFSGAGSATLSGILRAMEWVADPDGNAQTPDKPRVVNNSWGGSASGSANDDPFYQAVLTWVELEIFPSFAAGNEGPGTETIGSPGCLPPSFAVGATDENDQPAKFSSRGPVNIIVDGKKTRLTKPDVSAPGVQVLSSIPGGKYAKFSGTSMATPHVTGSIALMYQLKPKASIKEIRDILTNTASDLGDKGADNTFGSGRIDMVKAAHALSSESVDAFDWGYGSDLN